jgi:hypothetical protein
VAKSPSLSADVEADLKALETRTQPDFTPSSGPKRRYPAGKVKRYPEEDEDRELKIPQNVLRGLGKTRNMAKGGGLPDLTGDGKITRADVLKGRGVFKKGGAVKSSASRRADGIAQRGKTKGRFV